MLTAEQAALLALDGWVAMARAAGYTRIVGKTYSILVRGDAADWVAIKYVGGDQRGRACSVDPIQAAEGVTR